MAIYSDSLEKKDNTGVNTRVNTELNPERNPFLQVNQCLSDLL